MHMPSLLRPGDTVAILATSGPCDGERLAAGLKHVEAMGLVPMVMDSCRSSHGYLAGQDDVRLRDLHMAFASPEVRGIFVARGGYGAGRLLPRLDYDLIARNPKVFVGYSDVTALHVVFNQRCGFVTFHGPMVAVDFCRGMDAFTIGAFKRMVFAPEQTAHKPHAAKPSRTYSGPIANPISRPLAAIVPGRAAGPLTGGNLCLLAASIGTPYEVDTCDRILFLEETGEEPYRIDRMLLQLKQAGKFKHAAGIILGDFAPQTIEKLHICISELIAPEGKPTMAGLACGHTSPNLTLPLGRMVEMDATGLVLQAR